MLIKKQHIVLGVLWVCSSFAQLSGQLIQADTLSTFLIIGAASNPSALYSHDTLVVQSVSIGSLTNMLNEQSALDIMDYGVGNISNASIRGGAASHTLVQWNGIPMNSPTLGSQDLSLVQGAFLTNVEIHNGAGSLLSGSGGIGGVIVLESGVRKTNDIRIGKEHAPAFNSNATLLEWNSTSDKWSYRASAQRKIAANDFKYTIRNSSGLQRLRRAHASQSSQAASISVLNTQSPRTSSSLNVEYLNVDRDIPAPIGVSFRGESFLDKNLRMSFEHRFKNNQVVVGYINDHQVYSDPLSDLVSTIDSDRLHAFYFKQIHINRSAFVQVKGSVDRTSGKVNSSERNDRANVGFFTKLDKRIGDQTRVDIAVRLESNDKVMSPLTGAFGVSHRFRNVQELELVGNFATTYHMPTFNDLYWPGSGEIGLLPEHGNSVEMGINFTKDKWDVGMVIFRNKMNDLITWNPGENGLWSPSNAQFVETQGMELRADWRVLKGIDVTLKTQLLSYLEIRAEYDQDVESVPLYSPNEVFLLRIDKRLGTSAKAFARTRYRGVVHTDRTGDSMLDPLRKIDVGFSMVMDDQRQFTLKMTMHNIENRQNEVVINRPLPSRHVQFNLTYILPYNE